MVLEILAAFTAIPQNVKKDDSCVDRLHHRYTVVLIVTFAVVVSATQYVGTPITCWVPAEFSGGWQAYTNSYCWIKNTYFLPYADEIPKDWEPHKRDEIIYYQWVPFIMLAQAAMFFAPSVIWHGLNSKAGVDSDDILSAACTFNKAERMDTRDKTLTLIVNQMHRFLGGRRTKPGCMSLARLCGKHRGNYLIALYIIVKVLYIANVFVQMFLLSRVLQTDFFTFGVSTLQHYAEYDGDNTFINNSVFPKVTMCDFWVRRLGNEQRYTVQCALPINLYTEKMYVVLWFWMLLLAAITVIDLVSWLIRITCREDKLRYVRKHLQNMNRLQTKHQKNSTVDFVYEYLKQDGTFLLRMIGHNTNYITVSEVIAALWDQWRDIQADHEPPPFESIEADEPQQLDESAPMLPNNNRPNRPPPPPPPKSEKPPLPPSHEKPPVPPKPSVTPSAPPEKPPIEEFELS